MEKTLYANFLLESSSLTVVVAQLDGIHANIVQKVVALVWLDRRRVLGSLKTVSKGHVPMRSTGSVKQPIELLSGTAPG